MDGANYNPRSRPVFPRPLNLMLISFSLAEIAWAKRETSFPRNIATKPVIVPNLIIVCDIIERAHLPSKHTAKSRGTLCFIREGEALLVSEGGIVEDATAKG